MVNIDQNDYKEMLFERHFEYIYCMNNEGKPCGYFGHAAWNLD